ncbi:MAG: type 1 glutamine amidotransferase [Thermoleophilaceae bacterium]|nr:type 1 glutamine amidotransferase [Thermoleophilaceae bacterium]
MAERVLVTKHVPWEGPHRIGDALIAAGFELDVRCTLDGDSLPAVDEVVGAVFMGGPMNVDEIDEYPGLLVEREWIADAVAAGLPVLGVCLGAQLLARALGSSVVSGSAPEIGWAPVTILDDSDPLARHLAPEADVLHWHGEVFDLPPGATLLASSARTEVQGFRKGSAWGFLFHAEADLELARLWMNEPSMREEALMAVGEEGAAQILSEAAELDSRIRALTAPLFAEFAAIVRA